MLPTVEAAAQLKEERAAAADFLIVGGVVSFGRAELAGMLALLTLTLTLTRLNPNPSPDPDPSPTPALPLP